MKNQTLKRDLSGIDTLLKAQKTALRLTWMLNQVVKLPSATEGFKRDFYAQKAKILHYFDRCGYVQKRERDSDLSELLTICIDNESVALHRKTRRVKNDARRFEYAQRQEAELSDEVHLWRHDQEEMYFALKTIITALERAVC